LSKTPRSKYQKSCFKTLLENCPQWFKWWYWRTQINIEATTPRDTPQKFKNILLLFIFYVESIDSIIPKNQTNFFTWSWFKIV
jgi:hypothetical protein